MRIPPTLQRTDLLVILAGPLLGLLLALLLGDWRWIVTGLLVSGAALALVHARQYDLAWVTAAAVAAVPAGLLLWLWVGDARWAVLGLFPIAFVAISRIATAIERRR